MQNNWVHMHGACTCQGKGFRHIGKKSSDTPSWCDLVLGSSHDLACVEFLLHCSHDKHEVIASSCKTVAFLRLETSSCPSQQCGGYSHPASLLKASFHNLCRGQKGHHA